MGAAGALSRTLRKARTIEYTAHHQSHVRNKLAEHPVLSMHLILRFPAFSLKEDECFRSIYSNKAQREIYDLIAIKIIVT